MENRSIIIFDGVCNFCNGSVNFIIKRDPNHRFAFSPMQSDYAQKLIEQYKVENVGVDTFLLVKNNNCYLRTDAAIEIAKELPGAWRLLAGIKAIPRPIRDWLYRFFAKNRYAIFGKTEYCVLPSPDVKQRFIGLD